jgi:hypothetical protein
LQGRLETIYGKKQTKDSKKKTPKLKNKIKFNLLMEISKKRKKTEKPETTYL